jgi:hypothetical protein
MSNVTAFAPRRVNLTQNIAVTASSTTLAMIQITGTSDINYRLVNSGANVIFIEFGATGTTPVAALATSMPMLPNTVESFTGPPGTVIAVIASAVGNTLYVTPGEGL